MSFNYLWRLFATGISFVMFGVGGLFIRLVCFPLLILFIRNAELRAYYGRNVVQYAFKSFVWLMNVLGVLRYQIVGAEKLQRSGLLILANHPTLIDVVFLISQVTNANCVVKAALARNAFTRGPLKVAKYICNNSGSELIDACIRSIAKGDNLVIFPEGTRTAVDGKIALQRGAANIAVRGGFNVTPVIIKCEPLCLTKGAAWWKIPPHQANFLIEIKDDIVISPFLQSANNEAALAARYLTDYLQNYFCTER